MGRRSSPTGSRKMYSGSRTLELRKTGRKTLIVVCGYLYLKRKNSSFRLFHSICASPIRHFLSDPKILHTLCFSFFRVLHSSQEKVKTMLLQNFGGVNKVYYGRCANGESSRTMPQSRVKEPEIHRLFGEHRRTINRGGVGSHFRESN